MILVDSSVWIDYFNGAANPETDFLHSALGEREILVGDLIYMEVLQGFRAERDFAVAKRLLESFMFRVIGGKETALRGAKLHRALRAKGITVRKTIDTMIASFCIGERLPLLHRDRDFDAFETHCHLIVVGAQTL